MTLYRIYQRYAQPDSSWLPVLVGDNPHGPVVESTDLDRVRKHFKLLVTFEKEQRREAAGPVGTGLVRLFPFVPLAFKIVAIPTVDVEVFDAPHPEHDAPAAQPDDGRPAGGHVPA